MPVWWLTKALWRKGLVLPVGWGISPPLVCGLWSTLADGGLKFFAKGFVPVAIGWSGAGAGDWKGELVEDAANGEAFDEVAGRAKGFVDWR